MLSSLYDIWGKLAAASIVVSIITALLSFRQWASKNKFQSTLFKKFINLIFVCSCVVVISSFLIGMIFTKAPIVYGKTVQEAMQIFNDAGLKMVLPEGLLINDTTRYMTVTGQSCEGNQLIQKGTQITVYIDSTVIRTPQKTVVVPYVVGELYISAKETLSANGLRHQVHTSGEKEISLDSAYVVSQSIAEGTYVPEDSLIELKLSSKKEEIFITPPTADMIEVPKVVDLEESEAVRVLEECGLTAQVFWITGTDETLAQYFIINQSIPAGSSVPFGTLIELERSGTKLDTPVTVPNVIGMEQTEATTLLKNKGLDFQVWWTEENNTSVEKYYIINQSIPMDSLVSSGTVIKLELSATKP